MLCAQQRGDVPGAEAIGVKDGQVLLQKACCYADLAKKAPVDPETTVFRPSSVSKLFTWTALVQKVEQGKLDLYRDIRGELQTRGGVASDLRRFQARSDLARADQEPP